MASWDWQEDEPEITWEPEPMRYLPEQEPVHWSLRLMAVICVVVLPWALLLTVSHYLIGLP